jgi:hypothetical protein
MAEEIPRSMANRAMRIYKSVALVPYFAYDPFFSIVFARHDVPPTSHVRGGGDSP